VGWPGCSCPIPPTAKENCAVTQPASGLAGARPVLFYDLQRVPEHRRHVRLTSQFGLIPGALYYTDPLPRTQPSATYIFSFETLRDARCSLIQTTAWKPKPPRRAAVHPASLRTEGSFTGTATAAHLPALPAAAVKLPGRARPGVCRLARRGTLRMVSNCGGLLPRLALNMPRPCKKRLRPVQAQRGRACGLAWVFAREKSGQGLLHVLPALFCLPPHLGALAALGRRRIYRGHPHPDELSIVRRAVVPDGVKAKRLESMLTGGAAGFSA
jgi:hypothetical protein